MNIRRATCGSHGAGSEQIVLPDAHADRDRRNSANPLSKGNLFWKVENRRPPAKQHR